MAPFFVGGWMIGGDSFSRGLRGSARMRMWILSGKAGSHELRFWILSNVIEVERLDLKTL
jgi:hypothetical protein